MTREWMMNELVRKRTLQWFRFFFVPLILAFCSGACFGVSPGKPFYPPYPEVWDWVSPKKANMKLTELSTLLLETGDVLIVSIYEAADRHIEREYVTMFGGKTLDQGRSDLGREHVVLSDGTVTRVLKRKQRQIKLNDGSTILLLSNVYRYCYRGPVREYVAKRDIHGNYLLQRVVFYLLDEAKRFVGGGGEPWFGEPNASCPNEGPLELQVQVESITGLFLDLPDHTFLMLMPEHSLVLRLDEEFNTRSPLLNRRIFIFDYHDDPLFVNSLTHKDYGMIEGGSARYQDALDDLYQYLLQIQRRN